MSRFHKWFTRFVAAAACVPSFAGNVAQASAPLTLFAAASLKEALDEQLTTFNATTGSKARASYAGSNALAKQIEQGAPASLFISADEAWVEYLAKKISRSAKDSSKQSILAHETNRVLLTNQLVLIAPASSALRIDLNDGAALEGVREKIATTLAQTRFAIADPNAVPAGKYARQSLANLGLWATIAPRIARTDNVRAALAFVARGESPLGVVYRSDALAEPRVRIVATLPASSHPPIRYVAAIVAANDSPAARRLLEFLSSREAAVVWKRFGFSIPTP